MKGDFFIFQSAIFGIFFLKFVLGGMLLLSAVETGDGSGPLEPLTLQLRSRIPEHDAAVRYPARGAFSFAGDDRYPFRIRFHSEPFDSGSTVAVRLGKDSSSVSSEWAERIAAVERRLSDTGISVITWERLCERFRNDEKPLAGKIFLFYGFFSENFEPNAIPSFSDSVTVPGADHPPTVLFFRDLSFPAASLSDTADSESDFGKIDRWRIGLEEKGLSSVSSGDLLGSDDFHPKADRRRSVVFIVSDDHYHADKTVPIFAETAFLGVGNEPRLSVADWRVGVIAGEGTARFRPIGLLDSADVAVVFVRRLAIPVELKGKLQSHLDAGKGLVGLRTASHAFAPRERPEKGFDVWPEFDADVLGGNYHNHGANDAGTDVITLPPPPGPGPVPDLPCGDWHSAGALYFTSPLAADAVTLQTGSASDRTEPLTWIRYYGADRARIAYSGLGHPDDFNRPAFRQLLTRLIEWAAQP